MRWLEVIVFFAVFSVFCFAQTTWYVPDDFQTIQGAIYDQSVLNGDVVVVRAGTYLENIDFTGKEITLKSELGPNCTTIDGSLQELSVVTFQSGEGLGAVLEGFTITSGSGTLHDDGYIWGGGIFCSGSSPTIRGNILYNNIIDGKGGGIGGVLTGMPLIQYNEICTNYAGLGGGICTEEGCNCLVENNYIHDNQAAVGPGGGLSVRWECYDTIIRYNRIENNSTGSDGGGIYIGANTATEIYGNLIIGNEAHYWGGGGINLWSSTIFYGTYSYVYNNIIVNNVATCTDNGCGGGGIYSRYDTSFIYNNTIVGNQAIRGGGLFVLTYSHIKPNLSNSILWNNTANSGPEIYLEASTGSAVDVEYCDIKRGWPGTGNINSDPLFVDPSNGDYHLTFDSPCMDMGNDLFPYIPLEDFEGNPRTAYDTVDMGADEFYPHLYYTGDATPSGTIQAKFVGLPGKLINGVIMGGNVFDPPLPCDYGLWYMDNPMQILTGLGTIPANGVSVIPGTIPASPVGPYTIYLQAAIDSWLTNLLCLQIQ